MNSFLLRRKVTFNQFFAYVTFYYFLVFVCAALTSKSMLGYVVVVNLLVLPFLLMPRFLRQSLPEIDRSSQNLSKKAVFEVRKLCVLMSMIILTAKVFL